MVIDDNVTHIITAKMVGLDQLAGFDCKGQAGPGVTFEIACKEVKRLTAEVTKYQNWFDQNGSVLATHNIGGFHFDDTTSNG